MYVIRKIKGWGVHHLRNKIWKANGHNKNSRDTRKGWKQQLGNIGLYMEREIQGGASKTKEILRMAT